MTDDHATDGPEPERRRRLHHWLRERFGSPAAVYGLIVYSVAIAVVSDHEETLPGVLVKSVLTLVIFFVAHVFAHTLADHGRLSLGAAIGRAVRHSAGMLYSSVPSTAVLLLGTLENGDAETTVSVALIVSMVVLAVLGYSAYAERGASRALRWVGAIGTGLLGFLIVALDYAVH
ncbi:hypothetical protein ABCS02_20280 [Microbacterium sp. X-17]|uniref:hypothetical protein n=1 Tax=Microbacterium sp. X-17 TaxID=3144404 RepID=UPI0031F51109